MQANFLHNHVGIKAIWRQR